VLPLAQPVFADNVAPATDADLHAIAHAAGLARQRAGACKQQAEECRRDSCKGSADLSRSLDDARVTLAAMQPRLAEARSDTLKHFQTMEKEYVRNVGDDAKMQKALAYMKFLSDFSKLMFDAASLADGVNSIQDIWEKLGSGAALSKGERALLEARLYDQSWELASGLMGAVDDFGQWAGKDPRFSKAVSDAMTYKGGASDLFGAFNDFRDQYKATQGKTSAGLRASAKSLGQLAGKFLGAWSDARQNELMDRMAENAMNEGAIDQAAYNVYADYRRLLARELALEQTLDAVRAAYAAAYACAAQCPNAMGPAPVPDTSGMTYGEMLKLYNPRLTPHAQKVSSAAASFSPKPCDKKQVAKPPAEQEQKDCGSAVGITAAVERVACKEAGGK
jgi:hypothetical protein